MESKPKVMPTIGPKKPKNVARENTVPVPEVSKNKKTYWAGAFSVSWRIACPEA
jgi:hypothetical protein